MNLATKMKLYTMLLVASICYIMFGVVNVTHNFVLASEDTSYVAQVGDSKYQSYSSAWSAVSGGGTITMLDDWFTEGLLTVPEGKSIIINMNGHMVNRGLSSEKEGGQIFLVKPNATLTINGQDSTTQHNGTIQNNLWHYKVNGNVVLTGGLLTGSYNSNGGGAIHIQKSATVNLDGVTIAGCTSSAVSGAGAIRVQGENAVLNIKNSEICYNRSTVGGGGAIRTEGQDSIVNITNSRIHHNVTTSDEGDGGAIQINHGKVSISSSDISFNTAKRNGGAIYITNGNLILSEDVNILHNTSNKEGGAIYVNSEADNVEIRGVLSGNYAKEEGGAIYVNSSINGEKGVKISNAEILGNNSINNGGGIFVDADNNIALAGKVVVNGCSPNNLYINASTCIASNLLTSGSSVGITTSWNATESVAVSANSQYFVCDKQGYKIEGDGSSFYFVVEDKVLPSQLSVNGNNYAINKGSFVYKSVVGGQMTAYYYYSDGYFAQSAKYYNEHFSTMSLNLAMSAVTAGYEEEYTEDKASKNVVELFASMGYSNVVVHFPEPEYFGEDAENLSTIGYVIASRNTTINGENVTIIATAVRGGGYGAEWASNVTLGEGLGEAKGFGDAARQVKNGIDQYIANNNIDTDYAKFWIAGFSRSAATSNLVAKKLTEQYGEDNVYAYCFEAPKGGVFGEMQKGYTYANIHSVINSVDIVPLVGPAEMGFIRYGVDHIIPAYKVGKSQYNEQKSKMLTQLSALNPNIQFNDYFHEATVSYVGGYIQDWFGATAEYIDENWYPDYYYAEDWTKFFIKKLQEYSLTNDREGSIYNKDISAWHGYRNYWATYKWYLYESGNDLLIKCYENPPEDFDASNYTVLTIERSIANIMDFYFGASGEKKEQITSAIDLGGLMNKLNLGDIYSDVIKKWNGYSIDDKNGQFNKVWNDLELEDSLTDILTTDEMYELKTSIYVVLDFLLDFVADDYDKTDQDIVGTLIHNIGNILQTHYFDVVCAWVRSYDSFYATDMVSAPLPPESTMESGTYREDLSIELVVDNNDAKIYYTLDGSLPDPASESTILYNDVIKLNINDGECNKYVIKTICIYNDLVSEVATYSYTLNTNAEISLSKDMLRVYNFDDSAVLILAEYDSNNIMQDIIYMEVTNNNYISINDIPLNFDNCIMAYLVNNLTHYSPLCSPFCVTEPSIEKKYIQVDRQNVILLSSFDAVQADNPEYINITVEVEYVSASAQNLIIALFEKSTKDDFSKVLYFNQVERSSDNPYSFTIKRELLQEALGEGSVNNSELVLSVNVNGIPDIVHMELVYSENVYTISYNLVDGGINHQDNPSVYTMSTATITLLEPSREHYDFVGWFDNVECIGDPILTIANGSVGNVELFAKWKLKQYTITYNDGVDDEVVFEDETLELDYNSQTPPFKGTPTREGYVFVGWNVTIADSVTEDVVYTAVWVQDHVHNPVLIEGVEATCTHNGYKSYWECEGCGYFEDESCEEQILDLDIWKQTTGATTKPHDFSEQTQDTAHLVVGTGINCQDAVRYYYGCSMCDAISTVEWVSDNYGGHNFDTKYTCSNGQHYHVCLQEGCQATTTKINCSGGNATCNNKAICSACGNEYGELNTHIADSEWHFNENEHWHQCENCEDYKMDKGVHVDNNGDWVCDVCECQLQLPTPQEDNKLSGGAIVAIVLGSTAVLSSGGFSIVWFGIKKKKWIDLINVFKKK